MVVVFLAVVVVFLAVVAVFFAVVAVVFFAVAAAADAPPFGASSRDFCVTPVALAIALSAAWLSSFSPRSALPMSAALSPTCSASAVWLSFALVRASFMSSPTFFSAILRSFTSSRPAARREARCR